MNGTRMPHTFAILFTPPSKTAAVSPHIMQPLTTGDM